MVWELVFMLVILKIPVVYLCLVVWWAIKAEPRPLQGAGRLAVVDSGPLDSGAPCAWRRRGRVRPLRPRPRGGRPSRVRSRAQVAR